MAISTSSVDEIQATSVLGAGMALNWVQIKPNSNPQVLEPLCLPGETIHQSIPVVDLALHIPHTIEGPKRKEDAWGMVWISDRRVIFLAYTPKSAPSTGMESQIGYDHDAPRMPPEFAGSSQISSNIKDGKQPFIKSLSVPYSSITSTKFNQPLFSANSISLFFVPVEGGGLPAPGRGATLEARLAFREGKVHAFWKMVEGCRERERRERREGEPLPRYEPQA